MVRLQPSMLLLLLGTPCLLGSEPDSGFFRVEEVSGKWLMLDAEGKPVYLRGLNHFGDGSHMPWNLKQRDEDAAAWRRSLPGRLRQWGFNYLPPSIGPSAIDPARVGNRNTRLVTRTKEWPAEHYAELGFPFTLFLEVPKQYMAGANMPDVFGQDFRKAVDERCQEVCGFLKDDPNLIGYHFCHNPSLESGSA